MNETKRFTIRVDVTVNATDLVRARAAVRSMLEAGGFDQYVERGDAVNYTLPCMLPVEGTDVPCGRPLNHAGDCHRLPFPFEPQPVTWTDLSPVELEEVAQEKRYERYQEHIHEAAAKGGTDASHRRS